MRLDRGLWLTLAAGRLCRADSLDAFWGTVTLLPSLAANVNAVTTVYDLNHKVVPATMRTRDLWARRALFKRSLARANVIVAISQGTAARIRSLYGSGCETNHEAGVSADFTPQSTAVMKSCMDRYHLRHPYLLAVGTREPRKNLSLLITTFCNMKVNGLVAQEILVLVGARGWKDRALISLLDQSERSCSCVGACR